jgi:hypothetical protein
MEYPISLDTALQIVSSMKIDAIKKIEKSNSIAEKEMLENEIDMYSAEENILYGSNKFEKLSIMDKIIRLYSVILKQKNQ